MHNLAEDAAKAERLRAMLAVKFPAVVVTTWSDWSMVKIQKGLTVRKTDVPRSFEGGRVYLERTLPSVRLKRKAPTAVVGGVDHDRDIRPRLLADLRTRATWICGEFSAGGKVDLATIEGDRLCGYEIKAAKDSLSRLTRAADSQVDAYSRTFDRVTLVCAEKHLAAASAIVPAWWGVTVALPEGFRVERAAVQNPVDPTPRMGQMLWQAEAARLMRAHGMKDEAKAWSKRPEALARLPEGVVRKALLAALCTRSWGPMRRNVPVQP